MVTLISVMPCKEKKNDKGTLNKPQKILRAKMLPPCNSESEMNAFQYRYIDKCHAMPKKEK